MPELLSKRTAGLRERRQRSWLRDSSITTKLATLVAANLAILVMLLIVVSLCLNIAAGVRAYVGGEGLWSKGQKDAVYYLSRYAHLQDGRDYQKYQQAVAITLGDKQARLEMQKPDYDYAVVEQGFVTGGNAAEDVPNMVMLFRHFGQVSYLRQAIAIWTEADGHIEQLMALADEMHTAIQQQQLSPAQASKLSTRLEAINSTLMRLEIDFSSTLAEGARWIQSVLLWTIFGSTALLLALALWLSWRIARQLRASILLLREAANQVGIGKLDFRIKQMGRDELGQLADVFNEMIEHRQQAQQELESNLKELARSNADLEQFAYIASHDLQEPLRTVTSYTQLLLRRYEDNADAQSHEFSAYITEAVQRMREMIDGLLAYSRISRHELQREKVDLNSVIATVLSDLKTAIKDNAATVEYEQLPTLQVNRMLIQHLFQNLVSNALKFHGDTPPRIHISARRQGAQWQVSVRDHGIGIDPQHAERIFVLFQRLHTRDRYAGNGLGLGLCRKIVEHHGGRIWVEPANPGSVFHFTLPDHG
jgi:two-component system, sensor histidine kinase